MGNGHGSVYLRANLWTIDFTVNGRRVREGIGTNRRQARDGACQADVGGH
jgi:hypothetical protein